MPPNPFVVGPWVRGKKFYGRRELIEQIISGPRNAIWLLGTRRVGKTSLLRQVEYLTRDVTSEGGQLAVFWDFQGADDTDTLHQRFHEALVDAEDRLEQLGISPSAVTGGDVFESITLLRRRVEAAGLRLLLLCDEVEELIKIGRREPSTPSRLRQVLQSHESVRSVIASTIRLWALTEQRTEDTSPFLNGYAPPLYVGRLLDDEAQRLARQSNLPEELQPDFSAQTADRIRLLCDSHPFLIQLVGQTAVELRDLDYAIDQIATDPMLSRVFAEDYGMLSSVERAVLTRVPRSLDASRESSQVSTERTDSDVEQETGVGILHQLEQLGYLRRSSGRRFTLANFFFCQWLERQPHASGTEDPGRATHTQPAEIPLERFEDRYCNLSRVGNGATSVVYRAYDEIGDEMIALKVLKPGFLSHEDTLERTRREVMVARRLRHPNVQEVYYLGNHAGRKYLAMQWIEGAALDKLIKTEGALSIARLVEVTAKLANALEEVHRCRIVHRDIKPRNILIDESGEPFLSDFGHSRVLDEATITETGAYVGTPAYSSPEQLQRQPVDHRSDIYSLGIVLFEMATGQKPFPARAESVTLGVEDPGRLPELRSMRPELPPALVEIAHRCLARTPDNRFQDARSLRLRLEAL